MVLDIRDKHRLIILMTEITTSSFSTITDVGTCTISIDPDQPIEFDKELFKIPSSSFPARRSFPPISIDVGLPEDPFKGMRVVDWLREMANYLDGVIAAFESLLEGRTFEPPDPIRKKLESTG
jgi:hypothetical protein